MEKADFKQEMKVKSQFYASITHELRTPVNGILGNVRELLPGENDDEKLRRLQLIERCCNDMNKIIDSILDFSKLEAGKFTLEPREFSFREMLNYVKCNYNDRIEEKGLEFSVKVWPEVPERIIADELRIIQILNNLLSNALKFTSMGKIMVEVLKTAQEENRVELFFLVADSGIGIDEAGKEKLFQRFSQVDASISRRFGGTGLGLNICKQLAELMGGSIGVESEEGMGTTFSFSIWAEVPDTEVDRGVQKKKAWILECMPEKNAALAERAYQYATKENLKELEKNLSKMILSVEMGNWEKAEMFINMVRGLTKEAPKEIKNGVLKLKMAVQKGDYDKTTEAFETLERKVLYALANAAAENASFGKDYVERLSCNCRLLAQSLQLSPAFEDKISDCYVETIALAAPLCDVGNISIPMEILQKKSGLSKEERSVVKTHASIGAKLLENVNTAGGGSEFIKMAIEIANFHHEKWDGSGYPEGRKGEEIPLSAQIVSMVSVFCALTEERSYRESCSREEALSIMKEEASERFNPDIFDIYCKISRQLC